MSLKSKSSKLALCAMTGALTAAVAAGPAIAADGANGNGPYKGRAIAKTGLLVRSGPSQAYPVVGFHEYNSVVDIICKMNGQNVDGNPRWYKLSEGRYAWSSARYIANIGAAPHWC